MNKIAKQLEAHKNELEEAFTWIKAQLDWTNTRVPSSTRLTQLIEDAAWAHELPEDLVRRVAESRITQNITF
jgi:hypothetical protein